VSRRDQILATAAELFATRGFHGVSVADIGAACGISGPALYKHFPGKQAVLAEMLVSISEELLTVGQERVAGADGAEAAITALVDWHVELAPHPDLDTARAMAHAAFGLINSTPHSALLPDEQMRAVLTSMALGALGRPQPRRA
jgi:AcrR family transcriptional regulator